MLNNTILPSEDNLNLIYTHDLCNHKVNELKIKLKKLKIENKKLKYINASLCIISGLLLALLIKKNNT
jgi:hypothetical protein